MTTSAAQEGEGEGERNREQMQQVEVDADTATKMKAGKPAVAARETRDGKGAGKRLHESSDEEGESDGRDTREGSQGGDDDDGYDDREDGEEDGDEEGEEHGEEEGEEHGEIEDRGSAADPPLPPGPPPGEDDGWQAIWDAQHQAYYFYNALTGQTTWTNPRVPSATTLPPTLPAEGAPGTDQSPVEGEGDPGYEPTYYQLAHGITDPSAVTAEDIASTYASTGTFNRFTGKWQAGKNPENYNDENKSRRQMEFYFDVDAAANSHDGRSLKAERQMKKLSKKELKAFREKRKEKKEQKRRAWYVFLPSCY
ncbi:hypothetical protein EV426DRAFT_595863 [Tirmania nivea]|nr:hypothetical protein EV426DRAFT_595863 [Tirmania nivea]